MNPVFTIGHSTRSSEEFITLLREYQVELLIDVRRFPISRRHPQFNGPEVSASLETAGIGYRHEEVLGGRRTARPDSPNTAWRNAQFRGYADHMDTPAFREAVAQLVQRAEQTVQAVMCAEAVPWRCHRNLLADALVARGVEVRHIIQPGKANPHSLNRDARLLADGRILYRARVDQMDLL